MGTRAYTGTCTRLVTHLAATACATLGCRHLAVEVRVKLRRLDFTGDCGKGGRLAELRSEFMPTHFATVPHDYEILSDGEENKTRHAKGAKRQGRGRRRLVE